MAEVITAPNNLGFVTEGEELLFNHLKTSLPDSFTIIPNLIITVKGSPMEIDLLVIGPVCIWVIETKHNYPPVKVTQHDYFVGDVRKSSHPVNSTRLKAQKLVSKFSALVSTGKVPFFQHLCVFSPAPQSLDVSDELKSVVRLLPQAVETLLNPGDVVPTEFAHKLKPMEPEIKEQFLEMLELDSVPRVPRFDNGVYESESQFIADGWKIWEARHKVTNAAVQLYVKQIKRLDMSPSEYSAARKKAFYPAELGARFSKHPYFDPPVHRFYDNETGQPILVVPQYRGKCLAEHDTFSPEEARKILLKISKTVQYAHNRKVALRTLDPDKISFDRQQILSDAFLYACDIDQIPLDTFATKPNSWTAHIKEGWSAPEHQQGGDISDATDRWFIGRLATELFKTGIPEDLNETVTLLLNDSPSARPPSLNGIIEILSLSPTAEPSQSVDPVVGIIVNDRYKLTEMITQEGFIEFWRGEDLHTKKMIGLKIFRDEDDSAAKIEYALLDDIENSGVVKAKDFEYVGNYPAIVMEWLEGASLSTHDSGYGFSENQVVALGLQILGILKSLHPHPGDPSSERLAHHNITPENIIIVDDRGPVLIDFGIYDSEGQPLHNSDPTYQPPQAPNGPNDPDADLFAVGKIMKEMLPIANDSSPLRRVLEKATADDRSLRFENVDSLVDTLLSLDIEDAVLPPVNSDVVKTRVRVWELIRHRKFQEAREKCPTEWVPLRNRIDEIEANLVKPCSELLEDRHGYQLSFREERIGEVQHVDGSSLPNADIREYLVEGKEGQYLLLNVYSGVAIDGEDQSEKMGIFVSDSFATLPPLSLLASGGLRISRLDPPDFPLSVIELTRATTKNRNGQPLDEMDRTKVKATKDELDKAANVDIHEILENFGAKQFGTREQVHGLASNRKNQYCFAVDQVHAADCLAVTYFLTRVLPLHNEYFGIVSFD